MFLYIFISTVLTQITIDDLQNYINTNDIVMITSPTCKNCKNAKRILQINNVAYKNVDIKENPAAYAYISKKEGISYVPVLYYKKMFLKNFAMLKNYIPLNENVNPQT